MFIPCYAIVLMGIDWIHRANATLMTTFPLLVFTFFLTLLLPLLTCLWLVHRGWVSDMMMENAAERRVPYITSLIYMFTWSLMLHTIWQLPDAVWQCAMAATAALAGVAIINRKWKISIHLASFGSFLGSCFTYCYSFGLLHFWLFLTLFGIALLLMSARLLLNAHTPLQVVCGFLLGLTLTMIPALWL